MTDEEIDNDPLYTDFDIMLTPAEIEEDKLYRKERAAVVRKLVEPLPAAIGEFSISLRPAVRVTIDWFDFYHSFCNYVRAWTAADTLTPKEANRIVNAVGNRDYFEAFLQDYFDTFVSTPNGSYFNGSYLLRVDQEYFDLVSDWEKTPDGVTLYLIRCLVNFVIKVRAAYPVLDEYSVEFHLYW
jgi:hypothetical protein